MLVSDVTPTPTPTPTPELVEAPPTPHGLWTWFVGIPLTILLTVVIATLALFVLRKAIRGITDGIASGSRGHDKKAGTLSSVLTRANPLDGERRAQRSRTIGSVMQSTSTIIVSSIAVLLVLGDLGVNLAPFLASAGIVGVALGFGAQSLVKDFLSGTFMLLEDQYGVGDTVDFVTVTGKVEEVALRVTKVRDAAGTLWYLRNGEILRVGNQTQEWANAAINLVVDKDSDIDTVRDALARAAGSVTKDPVLGGSLLEPPEVSVGDILTADGVGFSVHVRTRAAMQWDVQRALRLAARDELTAADVTLISAT
jgi:small conductance mechanosensitive channel